MAVVKRVIVVVDLDPQNDMAVREKGKTSL